MKKLFYFTMHIPIAYTIGIVVYVALLIFGIESHVLKACVAVPPLGAIMFFYLSKFMKFCNVHLSMIVFAFFTNVCMLLRDVHIIHKYLTTLVFRLLILSVGIVLLSMAFYQMIRAIYEGKKSFHFYCPQAEYLIRRKHLWMD